MLNFNINEIFVSTKLHTNITNAGFRLACRLPLCRYAAWSSLAVSELQLSAATPLWLFTERQSLQSWIEFNCLRSAAVGKAARLSIYWLDAACRLVIPLRQVALAQLNKYHHQSGNAASGKLVWNQHKSLWMRKIINSLWLAQWQGRTGSLNRPWQTSQNRPFFAFPHSIL